MGQRPNSSDFYDITVYARGKLARRLYDVPEQRALFRQRLGELNDRLWDESALLAQADANAMEAHREFLRSHGAALRAALAAPAPEIVPPPEPPPPDCPLPRSAIGGTSFTVLGLFGDGSLNFSSARTVAGAPIVGQFDATLYQTACLGRAE